MGQQLLDLYREEVVARERAESSHQAKTVELLECQLEMNTLRKENASLLSDRDVKAAVSPRDRKGSDGLETGRSGFVYFEFVDRRLWSVGQLGDPRSVSRVPESVNPLLHA